MVQYKLVYFPVRGRGDHIRQLFKVANVDFEDYIVPFAKWQDFKKTMPLGQLPVLEVDGQQIGESVSIARYLGKQFDMAGATALESARLDMIADAVQEMTNLIPYHDWVRIQLEWVKGDKEAYFKEKVLPVAVQFAEKIEKHITGPYLLGEKITWVDVFIAEHFSKVQDFGQNDALKDFPKLENLIKKVNSLPAMEKYIADRPNTDF